MSGRDAVDVIDFAVGGQAAVEILAVPGGGALLAVARVLARHVSLACYGVGLADPVGAATLGHRLAALHNARTRRYAILRIDRIGSVAALGDCERHRCNGSHPHDPAVAPP